MVILCMVFLKTGAQSRDNSKYVFKAYPHAKGTVVGASPQQIGKLTSEKITKFFKKYPLLASVKNPLDSFYRHRQYAFAWFDAQGLNEQAAGLYNHIQNIGSDGLTNTLPYQPEFDALLQKDKLDDANPEAEIMLTAQYFAYAKHVWTGLESKETKDLNWYLPRKKIGYERLLDSFIKGKNILNNPPVYRQYSLLKNQLEKYRNIKSSGGFPLVSTGKKSYKAGDSATAIVALRKWLFVSGDLSANSGSNIFDESFLVAVKKFQNRVGLTGDGIIAAASVKEMNVSVEARMMQIMVNMERSRWVPVSVAADYLVINIPEYKLHAYEQGKLLWSMHAVVGKPLHKTVIFTGDIKYVVFSPYWNVPESILHKEILPGIRRNKNYLANHHMEWDGNKVRQKSGPDNSLGLVKFLFPNSYDIYLHDTPAKSLFSETNRAFSHGCIRLSDAKGLAVYLLKNNSAWTPAKITAAMNAGKEQYVTLKKKESIFIVYFTAWVDEQGQLNFRRDLYNRDARLAELIMDNTAK